MTVLVIAEHHHGRLGAATLNTLGAAAQLGQKIQVLVAGLNCQTIVESLQCIVGIEEILVADHICYQHLLPEAIAPLIVHLAQKNVSHILAPATTFGKNLLPRVAAVMNFAQISDIIAIENADTYRRPIYAGNAIATIKSKDPIKIMTIRPTAFPLALKSEKNSTKMTLIDFVVQQDQSRFVSEQEQTGERPDLTSAAIVIAGGRGLGDKQNFSRLENIANHLQAAIGASRAAVDAGLAPNDWQVGQTGKIVAPKLYIALGISGAIQHLAGMRESKMIFAVNKDPEAPIFQIADYGLVADITDFLTEWENYLNKRGK